MFSFNIPKYLLTIGIALFLNNPVAAEDIQNDKFYSLPDKGKATITAPIPKNLRGHTLKHSGALDFKRGAEIVIPRVRLTLADREMGRSTVLGTVRIGKSNLIEFFAVKPPRFLPQSNSTQLIFELGPNPPQDCPVATVYTGRWITFFGVKICPGQVFNVPGESQCI